MIRYSAFAKISFGIWLLGLLVCAPSSGCGDVVWIRGRDKPLYGLITQRDESGGIEVQVRQPNGSYLRQEFANEEVEQLVVTIDRNRLSQLRLDSLQGYRDYAEELRAQRIDPEARDLAIRLYLICGFHGRQSNQLDYVESSLLGLQGLARDEDEEAAFEALAAIYSRSLSIQKTTIERTQRTVQEIPNSNSAKRLLKRAARLLRQQKLEEAKLILEAPEVAEAIKQWEPFVSTQDLDQILLTQVTTRKQLRKLLAWELALDGKTPLPQSENQNRDWFDQSQDAMSTWKRIPTFENVTEFDPRESIFEDNRWRRPLKQ